MATHTKIKSTGQREKEKEGKERRENEEQGKRCYGQHLIQNDKTSLQNFIYFWPKLCFVSCARGLGQQ